MSLKRGKSEGGPDYNPSTAHNQRPKRLPLWLGPVVFLGLFILVFAMVLWLLRENTYKTQQRELAADAESIAETIRMRLDGNRDYLLVIAKERGDGLMDATSFQERASRYVADHPEMICVNWVDADHVITDVAPIGPNRQIVGLRLNLPEPKRASRLAMEMRQPVYTRPFQVVQGELAFELWTPVFHDDVFLGLFGGIYSYQKLLRSLASPQALKSSHISVVDASGKVLLELPQTAALNERLIYETPLSPPENGVTLRFEGYRRGPVGWGLLSLVFLCLALVLGMAYAMWGLKREIEVRKGAEEALHRLNRELRAISDCNQVLVRAEDEQVLLDNVCHIVCGEAGYRMAWVGYAENDEAKTIRPVAWAGVEEGYLKEARLTWADTERGRGPSGTAIRTGQSACIEDFTTDSRAAPWRDSALQRGFRSSIGLPLKDETGRAFGALNIYSATPAAFTPDEVRLMEELAGDLAFGIVVLRVRMERKKAEDALYDAQQVYRALIENSPDIIARYDRECRRTYVNPTYLKAAQLPQQELIGSAPLERTPLPASGGAVLQNLLRRVLDTGTVEAVDVKWPRSDGIEYWYNIYAFPEFDREGQVVSVMTVSRDITDRKRAEQERLAHLRFLEAMAQVNQAMQGTNDIEQVLSNVLGAVFSIFECDRVWLVYPCDPDAPSFRVPMEITRPEYPGAKILSVDVPMSPGQAQTMREALESDAPVTYTAGTERPIATPEQFGVQSQMFVPVRPKLGAPWIVGMHQCSYPRVWTPEDVSLFREISRRLADDLTSLLILRDLRESEGKLAEAQRIAHIGYWDRDYVSDRVTLSGEACRIGGMPPQQRTFSLAEWQEQWLELIHPADRLKTTQAVTDALQGGARYDVEYRIVRPNGEVRTVHSHGEVTRDASGRARRMFGTMQDITDRKRTEEALRETEQKYRLLVANAGEAIFIAQDGVLKFPNAKTLELTGYSAEELASMPFAGLLHPEERDAVVERYLRRPGGSGSVETPRFRIVDKQGRQIWTQLSTAAITWEERPGTLCFLRDITEEKKLEAQFLQAQKMEAVGQLAGGVAHDFNNLLQVILGYVDVLEDNLGGETTNDEALGAVRQAAARAADLTRQLLAFSRRQLIQPASLDMNTQIQGVLKMIRRVIGEHIELCYIPGAGLGAVYADKGQLEQVITNLCLNARDAMPKGGTLTIKTENAVIGEDYCREHPWAAAGRYVSVSVTDTGQGMDEATRAQIFEPFFTTKDVGQGTGLGLATVYGIVRQHNGLIQVLSEPGKGAEFKIYMPRAERPAEVTEPKIEPRAVGGTETILVAEDEEVVRRLVSRMLKSAGYTVVTACDGEDALRVFEERADGIDLALLDVMMPKLGGRGVMERIQAKHPGMRFLFSSGYTQHELDTNFVGKDGLRLITKPYQKSDLLRVVREVLDAP